LCERNIFLLLSIYIGVLNAGLEKVLFLSVTCQLGPVIQFEFLVYVVKVHLDGALSDEQPLCYFYVTKPPSYVLDYFDFPRCQNLSGFLPSGLLAE
jgi:hypothetical protein